MFTNAVEWLGHKLELGQGAIGSLLAAVATALPESIIPVVAIVGSTEGTDDVATGAILGAPFLLATIAMALVGVAAFVHRRRRPQGLELSVRSPALSRDLAVFIVTFSAVLALGLVGAPAALRLGAALALVLAYAGYVYRTLARPGDALAEDELEPLAFDPTRGDPPGLPAVIVQLGVALGAMIGGARLFVEELLEVAEAAGVDPLVLSLVLAPLATELPEKLNSLVWIREGKDALALGNITGAMVFQSTLPVAFVIGFTRWELDEYAILAGALALGGAVVAILALQIRRRFSAWAVLLWGALYALFVLYVVATA